MIITNLKVAVTINGLGLCKYYKYDVTLLYIIMAMFCFK